MKALSDAKQAQMNRMITDAFKFEHTGRERHSPMTILRRLTRIQGFNPPPQPSPERPPIPGSSQWKKLTPKSARTRHISIPGEEGDNNPFLANSTATATAARTPTSNGSGRTPLGRQSTMSNVAAATAQQLAFVRYREENPFLDPEDFYQRWEDEESEVARLNQQSFRTSFGFGAGMAQDESLLEMDGDTGNFSLGQADMSNLLVDPADLGNRSRHIDDITLMSDSAFRNEGKEQGVRQDRGPEIDRDIEHGKDQHGQPPVDELEEMDQGMDLEQDPESLEADTAPNSTEAVQQDVLEVEMEEQEEVEPEQLEVTEEEEEEIQEERMEQERQDASEQEATGEVEQDQTDRETQDVSEKDEEDKVEDDHEENEPSQDQPDPFMEAEQEAFDQDLEAEAFAAQMEEDEAAELAEMEAAMMAQLEEDKAEAAALEAAKVTQMEEDAAEAAESEAARVAQLKELLDLEGHDLLGENDLIISPELQDSPITLQESVEMDEGHDKDTDIILEHPTDVDAALHTNISDDTNMGELKSPDAREQSPIPEEQVPQEHEDGFMNVHEEDHIEQQEHEEQHDDPGTQYFDDFPSELGMMSNGEFLPVSQPTTKKSARTSAAGLTIPTLPTSLQKQLIHTFSRSRISQEAMQVILEGSNLFFEQAANDLAAYANHAGRKTIDESDVECLMQRLRITNDRVNVESLLQRYLPRELRDLVLYPSDIRQFRRR
ncbi:hypothetical protein BGZ82_004652 [Podila clonocystis]|nr:hypothetical protein BGZ82_004652 [Podila clonocystis]